MTEYKCRYDFEIGYLVKSPCRNCKKKSEFPRCLDSCEIIDALQKKLAGGVSCRQNPSVLEPYTLSVNDRDKS
jgi:hypothetical protein